MSNRDSLLRRKFQEGVLCPLSSRFGRIAKKILPSSSPVSNILSVSGKAVSNIGGFNPQVTIVSVTMKLSILGVLALAALTLVLSGCRGVSEAEKQYNAGLHLQEQGRLEEAIQDYDEAIRLDPQDADAYINRALAYTLLGKDAEANRDVDRAVELGINRSVLDSEIERLKRGR